MAPGGDVVVYGYKQQALRTKNVLLKRETYKVSLRAMNSVSGHNSTAAN